jgi:DNA-binding SARP family transcriptional activator/tetratricopeptide (TPR) repeat protein
MNARPYLRCLGAPALFTPAGEPIRFRTKKHLALLVYLAVEGRRFHRRDRLGELLWPNVSLSEARHSLATGLSILRPRLGPGVLESGREHVVLARDRVAVDLDRLAAGDVLGNEITGPLEVAAFLDGFEIADSCEFMMWRDRQQSRLLPAITEALIVLIDRCRRTGDSRQIEQLADRMLALDELSEEAIRAKMEARAFAGDRLTALRIFEEWKQKLAEEIGAVPSELLEGMAVRLRRRGWERTTMTEIPTVPTDQWRGRPFIGRTAEYRVLYEAWERMRKGMPGHVLVLGDSGIGKTTLVERLTTAAGLEGAAISRVQSYDVEREIPYATLGNLIQGLLDRPGVSATPPEALAELARTVPEIQRRFPGARPGPETRGETARIRLTEAFLDMLKAIADEHPVVLVVDDLHLADDASLAVLHLVMRRTRGQQVMILLIARPGELEGSPQAARLRESALAVGLQEIELSPLDEEESSTLLRSLIPLGQPEPHPSVRGALLRAASGFPMVLELVVQDWQTNGDKSLTLALDAMTTELGGPGVSQSVYRQVLDRIARTLDSATHNVLNMASILGRRLNDLDMYALADLRVGQVMAGLAELSKRRVLRDAGDDLEFVNELVRAAAYLGVPSPLRKSLHSHIADRLIQGQKAGSGQLGLEIAWHCIRAGRESEATPYLWRGAREALTRGAPQSAERALSSALPHLRGVDRQDALVLLAESLQEQSLWQESLETLGRISTEDSPRYAEIVEVLSLRAQRSLHYFQPRDLAPVPEKLLRFIRHSTDGSSMVRAAVEAASILNSLRQNTAAATLLASISALSSLVVEDDDKAQLLLAQAMLEYNLRDFEASEKTIHKALAIHEKEGAANSIGARLFTGIAVNLAIRGTYDAAVPWLEKAYFTAMRIGSDQFSQQAAGNLCLFHCRLGNYAEAVQWAERAFGTQSTRALFELNALLQGNLVSLAMLGRASKVHQTVSEQAGLLAAEYDDCTSQSLDLFAADAFLILGNLHEATEHGRRATAGHNHVLFREAWVGPYARWTARVAIADAEGDRAIRILENLNETSSTFDAIDKAEVLAANAWVHNQIGRPSNTLLPLVEESLRGLPAAVSDQLRRMGMLEGR